MPPRNILPISAPDTPNPWLTATSTSTSRAAQTAKAKAKAREEQRSATTKDLANEMLGELKNLPIILAPRQRFRHSQQQRETFRLAQRLN